MSRVPALWATVAIAIVHAAVWAAVTPLFHVPDEPVHAGYVEYVAETGELPSVGLVGYDPPPDHEEIYQASEFHPEDKPTWSVENDREVRERLDAGLDSVAETGAGYASNNPPLYYVTAAPAYKLGSWGNALDSIFLVRLWGALLAGLTVGFVFLFLREVLPAHPWTWTLGALAVAFHPVFAFISGGVNNDALIFAEGAALLFVLARAMRRGLTWWRAIAVAAVVLAALLTKGQSYGLVPGAVLGLAVAAWRTAESPAARLRTAAIGSALAAAGVAGYIVARGGIEAATSGFIGGAAEGRTSLSGQLSYAWQYLLPQLPFMEEHFPLPNNSYPLFDTLFEGFVGRFGWATYQFDLWVIWAALGLAVLVVALAAVELWSRRDALRARWPELLTYAVVAAGVWGVVLVAGYRYRQVHADYFEQARYFFPLLGLYGGTVALAARGAGRWGRAFAGAFVTVVAGHALLAILLTLEHFYL